MKKRDTERKKERKDEKEKALKREGGRTHVIRSSFDLLIEFVLVLIPERRITHQQDVQNHTCGGWRERKKNRRKERSWTVCLSLQNTRGCVFACSVKHRGICLSETH